MELLITAMFMRIRILVKESHVRYNKNESNLVC